MTTFEDFNLSKQLIYAIDDLGFVKPTPIQKEIFSIILSGKDVVGISQTGTGKTFAYMLPILRDLKFSKQTTPRVVVLVPTRELVLQVVENIESYSKYIDNRVLGVYGGVNINTQAQSVMQGCDVLVATPGRFYDLALNNILKLKTVKKLVIDEVDVMLDLGFLPQLTNIFELLPEKRQNIMFSATMTEEVDTLIDESFIKPEKVAIAISGTPLENIKQEAFLVRNFYTKVNLLVHLLRKNKEDFKKILVFVSSKKNADLLYDRLGELSGMQLSILHSNKSQNFRIRSLEQFDQGKTRVMIATDIMARGLDLDKISHVVNFDVPSFPENYLHRIGRTGRAEHQGNTIMLFTEKEEEFKLAIEELMDYKIPVLPFPDEVEVNPELTPDERPNDGHTKNHNRNFKRKSKGEAFHEKSDKNKKLNLGSAHTKKMETKYKRPKTRGDKKQNNRKKKKG